jgi:hypothetical protein
MSVLSSHAPTQGAVAATQPSSSAAASSGLQVSTPLQKRPSSHASEQAFPTSMPVSGFEPEDEQALMMTRPKTHEIRRSIHGA